MTDPAFLDQEKATEPTAGDFGNEHLHLHLLALPHFDPFAAPQRPDVNHPPADIGAFVRMGIEQEGIEAPIEHGAAFGEFPQLFRFGRGQPPFGKVLHHQGAQ